MPRPRKRSIDFMKTRPQQAADESRQLREAENVLSSYTHAVDFLAEALQNATDAVDARTEEEPDAPRRIDIVFDASRRRFSVADTGIGMSEEDINIVLTPNVSRKSGKFVRASSRRSRGEKGVGLSFLALASNLLEIRTCDGNQRQDVVVRNARAWVLSGGKTPKPIGEATTRAADAYGGSERYTIVTVGDLDPNLFNEDLFALSAPALRWVLRTRTAIGNTSYLFDGSDFESPRDEDIAVELTYVSEQGQRRRGRLPYRYATPEELVPADIVLPFSKLAKLSDAEVARRCRGAAVRYVQQWRTASYHHVDMYAFVIDGREMHIYERAAKRAKKFFPDEWQGFFIATRDMPTGIPLDPRVIQPRTYERRMFVLLQDDELTLDLGRKTLAGQTAPMMRRVVESAWKDDLQRIVPRVQPSERDEPDVDESALKAAVVRSRKAADLDADIPYLKEPDKRSGVIAIFHELVALPDGPLPKLRTLKTSVFTLEDSLIYKGNPNGVPPMHVLFGFDIDDIVADLEREDGRARTAQLAVVWDETSKRGLQMRPVKRRGADGATHELMLRGIAHRDAMRVIVLRSLVGVGNEGG